MKYVYALIFFTLYGVLFAAVTGQFDSKQAVAITGYLFGLGHMIATAFIAGGAA